MQLLSNYVLLYVGSLWAVFVLLLLTLGAFKLLPKYEANEGIKVHQHISPSIEKVREYIVDYINFALPSPFITSKFSWENLVQTILSHHRQLRILKENNSLTCYSRVRMFSELATVQTVLCCCVSYGLIHFFSDDETCSKLHIKYFCGMSTLCRWDDHVEGVCRADISYSIKLIGALALCTSVMRIPIGALTHWLFGIISAPSICEISLHRHIFDQPLLHERRTCGWSNSLTVLGHELHRTEYIRVVPERVSQHRRAVFDMCERHAQDVEEGTAGRKTVSAHPTRSRKKIPVHHNAALSATKSKRGVFNETTIVTAIDKQRRLLSRHSVEEFDAGWGWNPSSHAFSQQSRSSSAIGKLIAEHKAKIKRRSMKHLVRDSCGAFGMELLHTFIADVLGGDHRLSSKLFLGATRISFPRLKNEFVVFKLAASLVVLALNFASAHYMYTRARKQDDEWQWIVTLACCLEWMLYELVIETLIAGVMGYCIPRMVAGEVRGAVKILKECAHRMFDHNKSLDDRYILNAPDFLFMSNTLARTNTHLFESSLIFSYRTFLPGLYGQLWNRELTRLEERTQFISSACGICNYLALSHICSIALKQLGSLPESCQHSLLHTLLFVLAGVVVAVYCVTVLRPWIVLVVIGLILLELRVWRSQLAGHEADEPIDESIMFDDDILLEYFPPPSPRVFTVEHNKSKRLDKLVEALALESTEPPEDDIADEREGGNGIPLDLPLAKYTPQKKYGVSRGMECVPTASQPRSRRREDSLGRNSSVNADAARIVKSTEKLSRLYDKVNRKFRVMTDTVQGLESTLANVASKVNGLNVTMEERIFGGAEGSGYMGGDLESHGGSPENYQNEHPEKSPSVDSRDDVSASGSQPAVNCLLKSDRLRHEGDKHIVCIEDGKNEAERDANLRLGKEVGDHPYVQRADEPQTPPKIHVLDEGVDAITRQESENSFNLIPGGPVRMQCGSPLIVLEKNVLPQTVVASNEAKRAWIDQKKSLKIRRNLVLGKDGLDGISVSDGATLCGAENYEEMKKRSRNADQATSPSERKEHITLAPVGKNTKKRKKREQHQSNKSHPHLKKVLPEC